MTNNVDVFTYTQATTITPSKDQKAYAVHLEDWNFLKKLIKNYKNFSSFWLTLSITAIGISVSTYVAFLQLKIPEELKNFEKKELLYDYQRKFDNIKNIAILFFIIFMLSLIFYLVQQSKQRIAKDLLETYMTTIEEKHESK